jgi:hypothetical protein
MSDISNFVRRSSDSSHDEINKLLSIITPIAFAEPEDDVLKERDILADQVRNRTTTFLSGTDITETTTHDTKRYEAPITIIPDVASPTAFPVTPVLTGTLSFTPSAQKNGAGALFDGTQYITLPDDPKLDLTGASFGMAFWFKGDGVNKATQTIWNKMASGAGLRVSFITDDAIDYCSSCADFSDDYILSTAPTKLVIELNDGSNSITGNITPSTDIYDGSWHSIIINSSDIVSDYCSACTDFSSDFSVVSTPNITLYVDGSSEGTIDHSTITGSLSNSEIVYLGVNNSIENPVKGYLAYFEFQDAIYSTSAITDYHSNKRINVTSQKASFHFIGNDDTISTLDKVY